MNVVGKTGKSNFLKENYPECPKVLFFSRVSSKKIGPFVISFFNFASHKLNNKIVTDFINRLISFLFELRSFFGFFNKLFQSPS